MDTTPSNPAGRTGGKVVELRSRIRSNEGPMEGASMNRVRVLFVIDELDIGGTEQQILEIVRRIDRTSFEPVVCCFRDGRKASEIEGLGVRVLREPKRLKADPGLVLRLAAMMRRERFD